jgi:hypothetical protein
VHECARIGIHVKWYFSVPEDRREDYSCQGASKCKLLVYLTMTVGLAGVSEDDSGIAGVPEDDSGNCWCTGG